MVSSIDIFPMWSLPYRKGGEYAPLGVCVCVTERSQLGLQDNFTL